MNQHPLSAAFPSMPTDELETLAADIKLRGQREPGVVYDGLILDGWHRYQACERAGVPFRYIGLAENLDPVEFVLSRNLHRRHLNASQRAAAIVACSDWLDRGKPKSAPGAELSTATMAKTADVGTRTIEQAKVAHRAGLTEAVKEGKVSVKRAAEIAKLPEPERHAAIDTPAPKVAPPKPRNLERENEELRAQIEELQQNLPELRILASAADAFKNDEQFKRIMQLETELSAVKQSRDQFMRENAELKRQNGHLQRQLKKAGAPA